MLPDTIERERQLLGITRYLHQAAQRDLALGRGPIGVSNCVQLLEEFVQSGRAQRPLVPIIKTIGDRAVRHAAHTLVDRHGRVDRQSRYATDFLAKLPDLALSELVSLKLQRAIKRLRDRFGL